MSGDMSDSHSWVCQWHLADARDAANHPTMTRTDTHHEDLCGPNVSSVKVEKTCKRQWGCSWRFLSREMSKKKKNGADGFIYLRGSYYHRRCHFMQWEIPNMWLSVFLEIKSYFKCTRTAAK